MSGPSLVGHYRTWFGRLSPWRQVTLAWAQGTACIFLALTLLRMVGLTDSWRVVGLYTAVYGAGLGVVVLVAPRRARRKADGSPERPDESHR